MSKTQLIQMHKMIYVKHFVLDDQKLLPLVVKLENKIKNNYI